MFENFHDLYFLLKKIVIEPYQYNNFTHLIFSKRWQQQKFNWILTTKVFKATIHHVDDGISILSFWFQEVTKAIILKAILS